MFFELISQFFIRMFTHKQHTSDCSFQLLKRDAWCLKKYRLNRFFDTSISETLNSLTKFEYASIFEYKCPKNNSVQLIWPKIGKSSQGRLYVIERPPAILFRAPPPLLNLYLKHIEI